MIDTPFLQKEPAILDSSSPFEKLSDRSPDSRGYSFFFADAAPRNAQNASAAAIPTGASIPGNVEIIATILFAESARPTLAIPMKNNEAYIPIRRTIKTFQNLYRPSQREMAGPSRPPKTPLQKPSIIVNSSLLA
ncbi:hypothetical protein [Paraburkholderia sp. UCT31]|uniref:hypothetical protein n=1 Tax=Paraburkholderia sp. UCT31 TaxID=2615209 RepID=UPI0016550643|nr:hypothetical protein [Paraburkholderia sp. UCT31]